MTDKEFDDIKGYSAEQLKWRMEEDVNFETLAYEPYTLYEYSRKYTYDEDDEIYSDMTFMYGESYTENSNMSSLSRMYGRNVYDLNSKKYVYITGPKTFPDTMRFFRYGETLKDMNVWYRRWRNMNGLTYFTLDKNHYIWDLGGFLNWV